MRKKLATLLLMMLVAIATLPVGIFAETTAVSSTAISEPGQLVAAEYDGMITAGEGTVDSFDVNCSYNSSSQLWNATLSWVGTATNYNVWMDADTYAAATYKQGYVTSTSYTFSNIAPGNHTFYVSTVSGADTKKKTMQLDGLLKAYATYKAVLLKWSEISGATGYVIKKSANQDGVYETVAVVNSPSTTEYVDKVAEDEEFYYVVCPYSGSAESIITQSNVVHCGAIKVMKIKFTFATTRKLTSHTGGSVTHTFKKGYTTDANGFADGKYHFMYGGRTYYVTRISTKNHKISSISKKNNYLDEEALDYVNRRGLKSSTKYLIWVNTYTQQEYIFKGSKGKWNLKYNWEISTGAADTPTKVGVTKIKKKLYERHNLHYWNMCSQFSIHNKANSWKLGYPRSGGCVRNTTDHAKWIYNNCPIGTAVCIY